MTSVVTTGSESESHRSWVVSKGSEALKGSTMCANTSTVKDLTVTDEPCNEFEQQAGESDPVVDLDEDPRGSKNHLLGIR